jgi:hypothetical protein
MIVHYRVNVNVFRIDNIISVTLIDEIFLQLIGMLN